MIRVSPTTASRISRRRSFARKIMSTREDYPDAVFYTLMNLMDSHDTQRILWSSDARRAHPRRQGV